MKLVVSAVIMTVMALLVTPIRTSASKKNHMNSTVASNADLQEIGDAQYASQHLVCPQNSPNLFTYVAADTQKTVASRKALIQVFRQRTSNAAPYSYENASQGTCKPERIAWEVNSGVSSPLLLSHATPATGKRSAWPPTLRRTCVT